MGAEGFTDAASNAGAGGFCAKAHAAAKARHAPRTVRIVIWFSLNYENAAVGRFVTGALQSLPYMTMIQAKAFANGVLRFSFNLRVQNHPLSGQLPAGSTFVFRPRRQGSGGGAGRLACRSFLRLSTGTRNRQAVSPARPHGTTAKAP